MASPPCRTISCPSPTGFSSRFRCSSPGTDSRETLARVKQISGWLGDTNINPEVSDHIGYVADGGPRFILSLNPPLPASNIAYFVVTLKPKSDIDAVLARTRSYFAQAHGDVRAG